MEVEVEVERKKEEEAFVRGGVVSSLCPRSLRSLSFSSLLPACTSPRTTVFVSWQRRMRRERDRVVKEKNT